MSAELGRALGETLARTLEEAAFVFAEPAEDPPPFRGEVLEARIGFRGPEEGELRLVADAGLAASLAANLLGLDEEQGSEARARSADALGEILNMVVGAWVVRRFGESTTCRLGVPRVSRRAAGDAEGAAPGARARLVEESGRRIDLSLFEAGAAGARGSPGP